MSNSDNMDKKSWEHPWTTEEILNNRRDWNLAGDAGLLKHLEQFSENLTKRVNDTENAIRSMNYQLTETAILVDNITNTSLALANTQFIESRVQEDSIDSELAQSEEFLQADKHNQDFSATDLLASVYESIKEGLKIMDEKYEKVEVVGSDSEDEDDNIVPSIFLKPHDPYQDRPLPYVIGTEKWLNSTKVGLESSSSESEQIEEDEESSVDEDLSNKNVKKIFNSQNPTNIRFLQASSASSESNDIESDSNRDLERNRIHARSQDTLSLDTEPTTPAKAIAKTHNTGPPNFAEELAKRLGNVAPTQNIGNESNSETHDVFSDKSDSVFTTEKTAYNESASWKQKSMKPVHKNIIPSIVDMPPPMTTVSTAPSSAIDDLFGGGGDESDDSDDIFSSKNTSKNLFSSSEKDIFKPPEDIKQKKIENTQNITNVSAPTIVPESNKIKSKGLFDDDDDDEDSDDLFNSSSKITKPSTTKNLSGSVKKGPIGGVSILGNIDIHSSSKFRQRRLHPNESDSTKQESLGDEFIHKKEESNKFENLSSEKNVDAREIAAAESGQNTISSNPENVINTKKMSRSSGTTVLQANVDSNASSRLSSKTEDLDRPKSANDDLVSAKNQTPSESSLRPEKQQDNSSDQDDVFGPPPLPILNSKKPKSKVVSLFDDSDDSADDLFANTSPASSRSQKSNDFTPVKSKKKNLFEDENPLFDQKEEPELDIFGAVPAKSLSKVSGNLFDDDGYDDDDDDDDNDDLFANIPKLRDKKKDTKKLTNLFEDSNPKEDFKSSLPEKKTENTDFKSSTKNLFEDSPIEDLFSSVSKPSPLKIKSNEISTVAKSKDNLFDDDSDEESDLFAAQKRSKPLKNKEFVEEIVKREPVRVIAESKSDPIKDKKSISSIFDDSDDDGYLFGDSLKKGVKTSNMFEDKSESKVFADVKSKTAEESKSSKILSPRDLENRSIFDDENDDEADIFAEKKKSIDNEPLKPSIAKNVDGEVESVKEKSSSVEDSKKSLLADIKQKLEKSNVFVNPKTDKTDVDGATFSKKEPPKSLDLQSTNLSQKQVPPKKAVSDKMKNLTGKLSNLKILSPADAAPMFKKNIEEKAKEHNNEGVDKVSSNESSPSFVSGGSSPLTLSADSKLKESPSTKSDHTEAAVSFDEPVQVEVLDSEAYKNRVRIRAKRKPQSREARQAAVRQSEIDLYQSLEENKDPSHLLNVENDKSDLSLSKEYSLSANKNTLLSPSTDEDDLFEVPPDLPDDFAKEDALFGNATILTPDTIDAPSNELSSEDCENLFQDVASKSADETLLEKGGKEKLDSKDIKSIDPLHDESHDPISDPSQLFAFVTKTPSPEKKTSLFSDDDDSLFSATNSKSINRDNNKSAINSSKPKSSGLNLFDNDDSGDLFSSTKIIKKPIKNTKIGLFDNIDSEDDDDQSLFGSSIKKSDNKKEVESMSKDFVKEEKLASEAEQKTLENSLNTATEKEASKDSTAIGKSSLVKDIFDSSDDDDIFSSKHVITKKTTKSIFNENDNKASDNTDLFSKSESKIKSAVKKPLVTRDLKKTAEKIVEDPLSLFQDE